MYESVQQTWRILQTTRPECAEVADAAMNVVGHIAFRQTMQERRMKARMSLAALAHVTCIDWEVLASFERGEVVPPVLTQELILSHI